MLRFAICQVSSRVSFAIVLLSTAAIVHGAQATAVLVTVDERTRLRPVARFDGKTWTPACEQATTGRVGRGNTSAPQVVVTGGAVAEAVRAVPPAGTEWRQLEPLVRRLFADRERQENVSAAALASVPVRIDEIATSASASSRPIYYFRASKTIPDSRGDVDADDDGEVDPKGDLRIDVSGWLLRAGTVVSLGTNATLSWEQVDDRPEGTGTRRPAMTPVGIVGLGDTPVWVMQVRAGDSTSYTLYGIDAAAAPSRRVRLLVRTDSRC